MFDSEKQFRYGNRFDISFPDFPNFTMNAKYVEVFQEIGKHDIAEIYYQTFSPFLVKTITTGVPVVITWRNDKAKGTFIGYTTSVSYPTAQVQERPVKIKCVGVGYPLKEKSNKIWTNRTASEVMSDICNQFKLRPFITPELTRFNQFSLAGNSYWAKALELANRIGYALQIIGTELHFHPIDKMINQFMTSIPVLSLKEALTSPHSTLFSPTLDFFEPELNDFHEHLANTRSTKYVSGVDPVKASVYNSVTSPNTVGKNLRTQTKSPLFNSTETHVVTGSKQMAKSMSKGKAQLSRFAIKAKGTSQGDPRIAPWRTIEIRGTGEISDGFWVVNSVRHFMHKDGRYQTDFTCSSDGVGGNKPSNFRPRVSVDKPSRNIAYELSTQEKTRPTSSRLSRSTLIVKQSGTGFKVAPRRWVGR